MRSVSLQLARARLASEAERLFLAVEAGESMERVLARASDLSEIAGRLIDEARATRSTRLLGASPLGDRLAAAAVATAKNGLADHRAGLKGQRVLIIDGLMVTGAQVARARRQAFEAGARSVRIAVVASLYAAQPDNNDMKVLLSP